MAWSMFKDKDGKISGTSVSKVVVVLCVMLVWTIVSFHSMALAAVPEGIIWLVGLALGVGVANKGIDIFQKNKTK